MSARVFSHCLREAETPGKPVTDGASTPRRVKAIYDITDKAGYSRSQVIFVSAYIDRQSVGFKKTIPELEWNSFVWFASEPDNLFILHEGVMTLAEIISRMKK